MYYLIYMLLDYRNNRYLMKILGQKHRISESRINYANHPNYFYVYTKNHGLRAIARKTLESN